MALERYRRVLGRSAVRRLLLLGFLVRTPIFAGGIVLTLHVVSGLGRSYAAAGLVSAALTLAIAVSGPWRGRLLDRLGLRRVVVPSLVIGAACWSIAPFSGYWVLLALAAVAGLFVIPVFVIIRQALMSAVPDDDRRTVISLDSSAVELSFMIGPALAVWAATTWTTSWVLFAIEMTGVAFGVVLWVVNPRLHREPAAGAEDDAAAAQRTELGTAGVAVRRAGTVRRSEWFRSGFLAVCLAATTTTIVLAGSDIAIVAALRSFGQPESIGWVLATWGFGSLLGGLWYGGLRRSISAFWLLAALGLVTVPMGLATGALSLAVLSFVAGLLCAPTITATVDQASRLVPERVLGEAMGWHGSFMTAGMALGAPLAGFAIDQVGFPAGFALVGAIGVLVALLGGAAIRTRRAWARAPLAVEQPGVEGALAAP